jgi:23S rRNA (guanine1835-N2)-methyltransferase
MSQFQFANGQLYLERYPLGAEQTTLQAWDAADEYLLQNVQPELLAGRALLIFNDNFGALSCALEPYSPHSISDSLVSQQATCHNLALNGLQQHRVTLSGSLDTLPDAPGLVIIRIPKTLALLEQQLLALRQCVGPQTQIIAAGKVRDIHRSTLELFDEILGETRTSLAWKKARLIYCQPAERDVTHREVISEWHVEGNDFHMINHANVFSRAHLDIGARFFMQHLPQNVEGSMVDLGCGNGIIGMTALQRNPLAQMIFVDESYMAVASSQANVMHNLPDALPRCRFVVNNILAEMTRESLDVVLCNPPFHQGHVVSDDIAWRMFCDAKRCLRNGGELRIVANRHLDYYHKLRRLFGNCTALGSNEKFVVLSALKRSNEF